MAIWVTFLISTFSAVIVSIVQDGIKYACKNSACKSNCSECFKMNCNEYKSSYDLKKLDKKNNKEKL